MATPTNQGKKKNVTRRQHHVWRSYLAEWATEGKIFCLSEGQIFDTNPVNVGVERDFYKLPDLADEDIKVILSLIEHVTHPAAKELFENMIVEFSLPKRLKEFGQEVGRAGFIEAADERAIQLEEKMHSLFEGHMADIFKAIRRKDLSFYDDPVLCGQFCHFLCLQSFRTKGVQQRIFSGAAGKQYAETMERIWPLVRQIKAVEIGAGLMLARKKRPLILLENETEVPFITGDQPVINLLGADYKTPPKYLALYYPLSPKLAVILDEATERTGYVSGPMSVDEVILLNSRIQAAAHKQIFGSTRAVLESLSN